jgi:quercetin 2,3-dioxygenase
MLEVRRSEERGFADHGWLRSYHSFSFADYFDPTHIQFGPLRVINEDRVAPECGFGTHGHRDMEIISYVLSGELAHRDSIGNGSIIRRGDVQRMSAGSGVQHSEFNPSTTEPVHFLQIWIQPNVKGIAPSYEEKHFSTAEKRGRLRLIASPDGASNSVQIHQDARVYACILDGQDRIGLDVDQRRRLYVHVVHASVTANDTRLGSGDALMLTDAKQLDLGEAKDAEILVFDLP